MSQASMRVLQVGAGSMGTRRLRGLSKRQDVVLGAFDSREDRRVKVRDTFDVPTFATIDEAMRWQPDVLVISTPPDQHASYVELALEVGLHHFSEANLWTYDYQTVQRVSQEKGLASLPSCSLHFLPIVKEIKRICKEELGDLQAYQMALSTYLPGWHPDEGPEFYARQRHTSAGREMVPFELLWLNDTFGLPASVCGSVLSSDALGDEQEATWSLNINLENGGVGQLVVMHACPQDQRSGCAFGTNGWITFDIFSGKIQRCYGPDGINDERIIGGQIEMIEQAYDEEINTFMDAVFGRAQWPHSYYHSSMATATLAAVEQSALAGRRIEVQAEVQPEHLPDITPSSLACT